MNRHVWTIRPAVLAALLVGIVAYAAAAEWLDFDPLGPRLPDEGIIRHRSSECMLLWLVACSVVGWIQVAREHRPPRTARVWPLVVLPLALGAWVAAAEAWKEHSAYIEHVQAGIPRTSFFLDVGIPLIGVALPLIMAACAAVYLTLQARLWRQSFIPGICPVCNYDLTGNVSGTCPECGTPIVTDPGIPGWCFSGKYRWLPELADFPDAKARYNACQRARREYLRTPWAWLILPVMFGMCCLAFFAERTGIYWYAGLAAVMCVSLVSTLKARSLNRQSLRRQLEERCMRSRSSSSPVA